MITDKKMFGKGLVLLGSFTVVFILIFMPLFGGKNGLDFSDDLFNKLSKGSSNFFDEVTANVKKMQGKNVAVEVKFKSADEAATAQILLQKAGATFESKGEVIKVSGDLTPMLNKVVQDSQAMYNNDGNTVKTFYGMDEKKVMKTWWTILYGMIKPLQKEGKIQEANVVNMVNLKAIEPAYNFYGIPAESILTKIPTVAGLLIFYVIYTMWYGYAIFDLFGGIGLSMSKSKIKKEV